MSKRITKIENFNCGNIVTLNQQVSDRRYLTFDLWTDDANDKTVSQRYNQILLQINDVRVINVGNGKIYFDLTERDDVVTSMMQIEEHLMGILKAYLAKTHKKGNFNFCSVIKCNDNDSVSGSSPRNIALALNGKNDDYNINFYDREKQKCSGAVLAKRDSVFNIIVEIMYIHLDMIKGDIVVDTRLRMVMESKIRPTRTKVMSVDSFLEDDRERQQKLSTTGIKQSFDVTQTEVFEDDDPQSPKGDLKHKPVLKKDVKSELKSDLKPELKQDVKKDSRQNAQQLAQQLAQQAQSIQQSRGPASVTNASVTSAPVTKPSAQVVPTTKAASSIAPNVSTAHVNVNTHVNKQNSPQGVTALTNLKVQTEQKKDANVDELEKELAMSTDLLSSMLQFQDPNTQNATKVEQKPISKPISKPESKQVQQPVQSTTQSVTKQPVTVLSQQAGSTKSATVPDAKSVHVYVKNLIASDDESDDDTHNMNHEGSDVMSDNTSEDLNEVESTDEDDSVAASVAGTKSVNVTKAVNVAEDNDNDDEYDQDNDQDDVQDDDVSSDDDIVREAVRKNQVSNTDQTITNNTNSSKKLQDFDDMVKDVVDDADNNTGDNTVADDDSMIESLDEPDNDSLVDSVVDDSDDDIMANLSKIQSKKEQNVKHSKQDVNVPNKSVNSQTTANTKVQTKHTSDMIDADEADNIINDLLKKSKGKK